MSEKESVMNKRYDNQSGFSLLELGTVLIILSIMLGVGITFIIERQKNNHFTETQEKLDVIEKALARFVLRHQRLPCPANASLAYTHADFGEEEIQSQAGMDTCENGNYGDSGNELSAGMIPVQALGLPRDYTHDGWRRRFMYVIDERYANNSTTNTGCAGDSCFKNQVSCRADITDASCSSLLFSNHLTIWSTMGPPTVLKKRGAAYVLLSFGENGAGAYGYNGGTRLAQPAGTDEQENASLTFDDEFVQRSAVESFDDIVRYQTKHQLLDSIGHLPSKMTCLIASDAVSLRTADGVENHACADTPAVASPGVQCSSYSQAIDDLCLNYYVTIVGS